jgi:hypothetical protein
MLEQRIQRKLESIMPAQIIGLRKIYNSIKDGMSKPADWFEMEPTLEPNGKDAAQEIPETTPPNLQKAPGAAPSPELAHMPGAALKGPGPEEGFPPTTTPPEQVQPQGAGNDGNVRKTPAKALF